MTVVAQPTDFIGETPLGPGYYTYRLALASPGWFDIATTRDRAPN